MKKEPTTSSAGPLASLPASPLHFQINTMFGETMEVHADRILIDGQTATDTEVAEFLKRLVLRVVFPIPPVEIAG